MRVFVYYNLHKHVWSIKALEGPNKGRVIAHSETVWLKNCKLKVSKKGRERVLKERRKNVHAGVVGELVSQHSAMNLGGIGGCYITYNPYKYESFVDCIKHEPMYQADIVTMTAFDKPMVMAYNRA